MASTIILLGMLASAFAAPSGYGHSGSVHPTGSVRSHHLPSGTKASSGVRTHSVATSLAAQVSSVDVQYNQISAADTEDCSTVTTRIQVTITVTGDVAETTTSPVSVTTDIEATTSAASMTSTTSSPVVNVQILSSAVDKAESHLHYHLHSSAFKDSSVATEIVSAYVAHTTSTQAATTAHITTSTAATVSVVSSTTVLSPSAYSLSTTKSTAAAAATTTSSGKVLRGLAYQDASLVTDLSNTENIHWAYNWGSSTSSLPSSIKFIPTLWGSAADFTSSWVTNAQNAINKGSDHLFSFNEPDLASQADMSPAVGATAYKSWVSDKFGGNSSIKLCAPSVTNGAATEGYGLGWLSSFWSACTDCQIDCINAHWYGDSVSELETHISDVLSFAAEKNISEVWLTEFGLNGNPSADTISTFLDSAIPMLESQKDLTGYAYFMLSQGVLVNDNALNAAGLTYMNSS